MDDNRYIDDLDRERLIYYQGQYYKMKESLFSHAYDTSVMRLLLDPLGSWRLNRPDPIPMEYWKDLDYKYQSTMRECLNKFGTHFHYNDYEMDVSLLTVPIGTKIDVKITPTITILFGKSDLNYSVDIEKDKVYKIDYLEDATISSILGKVINCNVVDTFDYRGAKTKHTILCVDCSEDFGSDIRYIDSRNIRFIMSLSDLQKSMSVTRSYIGIEEPDDKHGEFGGWYNPETGEYKVYKDGEWITVPKKPDEEPEEGKKWNYNSNKMEWIQIEEGE